MKLFQNIRQPSAQVTEGLFGFELEVSRQDLAGGVVLQSDQSEHRASALGPVMAAGRR